MIHPPFVTYSPIPFYPVPPIDGRPKVKMRPAPGVQPSTLYHLNDGTVVRPAADGTIEVHAHDAVSLRGAGMLVVGF